MGSNPGDIRILLAASAPRVQIAAKLVLIEEGYRVFSATDGTSALEHLKADPPEIVITVLDLPHMPGPILASEARKARHGQPVPCLFLMQATDDRGFAMNEWDMILRLPFAATELLERVHSLVEALEQHAPPTQEVAVHVPKVAWQYELEHLGEAPPELPPPQADLDFDLDSPSPSDSSPLHETFFKEPLPSIKESGRTIASAAASASDSVTKEPAGEALVSKQRDADSQASVGAQPLDPGGFSGGAPLDPEAILKKLPKELRRGRLEEHGLGSLLIAAADAGFTGTLRLSSGRLEKSLQLRYGRPVFCSSNLLSESLGEHLFRQKLISSGALARSVEQMISDGIQQGEALVSQGAITREALALSLHAHVRRKVVNAFAWPQGDFNFEGLGSSRQVLTVEMQPLWLIADSVRLFTAPMDFLHFLDDHRDDYVVPSRYFARHTGALAGLTGGRALLEAIDGQRRVSELAARTKLDELFVSQLLISLHRGDLIRLDKNPSSSPAPAPRESDAVISEMPASIYGDWGALVERGDELTAGESSRTLAEEEQRLRDEVLEIYTALSDEDPFALLQIEPTADHASLARAYEAALSKMAPERFASFPDPEVPRMAGEVYRRTIAAYEGLRSDEGLEQARQSRVTNQEAASRRSHVLHADLRYRWGRELLEENKPLDALKQFVEAGRRNPDEPVYLLYAGWASYLTGCDNDEPAMKIQGRQRLENALQMMPVLAEGHLFLAQVALDSNELPLAHSALERAAKLDPNSAPVRALQARLERKSH